MSFPKYSSTQDSGVDWLGAVPEHWNVVPLKHIADFVNGAAFKPAEWAESGYPIIRIENLNGGENFNYFDGEPEHRYLVQDGALLFGWSGNRGTSFGPFRWSRDEVCVLNQHIFRVESHEVTTDELYWTLKAVTAHVEEQAHGIIGMVHITKGDLGAIKIPLPPQDEQKAISSFLDVETSKIDGLVSEQRRLIELLKEKRQAVISHAVTKGLNPNAPMKPSGIQWLGDVPQHWSVVALKYLASLKSGDGITGDSIEETGDYPVFGGNGLRGFTDAFTHDGHYVIIGRQGALCGNVNYGQGKFWASEHAVVATPTRSLDTVWLGEMIRSMNLNQYSETAAQPGLSMVAVGNLRTVLPPIEEQQEIAKFVTKTTTEFDSLSAEAERAIELLQERRTALISAAVTGKIDVRKFAHQETP